MDINGVNQLFNGVNNNPNQAQGAQNNQNNPFTPFQPTVADLAPVSDIYVPGEQPQTPQSFTPDMNRVRELWSQHEARVDSFRRMVETLLGQQAERQGLADGWSINDIEVTDEMRSEAQAMVDEGGYFSVEATAGRILDFAVALSGGDPERIDLLRGAVERAFTEVERMFGGELPEITQQTHAAVMEGFDQWQAAGSASAIVLLNGA